MIDQVAEICGVAAKIAAMTARSSHEHEHARVSSHLDRRLRRPGYDAYDRSYRIEFQGKPALVGWRLPSFAETPRYKTLRSGSSPPPVRLSLP
jgi:hypothetical protein